MFWTHSGAWERPEDKKKEGVLYVLMPTSWRSLTISVPTRTRLCQPTLAKIERHLKNPTFSSRQKLTSEYTVHLLVTVASPMIAIYFNTQLALARFSWDFIRDASTLFCRPTDESDDLAIFVTVWPNVASTFFLYLFQYWTLFEHQSSFSAFLCDADSVGPFFF